ncbi:hypothetical protein NUW58_g9539 [Xylaria curta]|uniref:Uncharacterized protein n=1 Tax=Xylaria curta TaxID=42375 RepID=A0ACC1MVG9_9PEZI|nr:hypothetical protein NUW58_g9539 [Xylaria curta]
MSANKSNNTACAAPFDDATSIFFEPVTTSVFKPGDTVPIRWYAGVVPQSSGGSSSLNMTFNLVLSAFRNESFVYDVLKNITVPFSGRANKEPVYWSYIPSAPCPITEISYFWPIPDTFMAASKTDFDYVLLVETIVKTVT